jgi:hypothetical protein
MTYSVFSGALLAHSALAPMLIGNSLRCQSPESGGIEKRDSHRSIRE